MQFSGQLKKISIEVVISPVCDIKIDEIPECIKNEPDFHERIRFEKYSLCKSCKENNYQPSPTPSINEDLLELGRYKNIELNISIFFFS